MSRALSVSKTAVLAASLLASSLGTPAASQGVPAASPTKATVLLNGSPLFGGRRVEGAVLVSLEDFSRQLSGAPRLDPALLAVRDGSLFTVGAGGCGACRLSVKQPGPIGPVTRINGQRYVPLGDIARALGAEIHVIETTVFSMTCRGGECFGGILGTVR